jgi:type III pantothenate kinase
VLLLLDIGNTRLKWAQAEAGRIVESGAVAHEGHPAEALAALVCEPPDAVRCVSVAGPAHELSIDKVCLARWQHRPRYARAAAQHGGLVSAYAQPERLGADRWVAMLAARRRAPGAACVVADAGTALTVDVIDADGRHLGGIIAAGLRTSEKAVLGATRFPVRDTPLQPHAGLGLDTEACVRQGAMLSCLGALDRAAAVLPQAQRFLAGGDAEWLLPHLTGWVHCAHLVFEGLLALDPAR